MDWLILSKDITMKITPLMQEQSSKSISRLLECSNDEQKQLFENHRSKIEEIFALSDFIATSCIRTPDILQKVLTTGLLDNKNRSSTFAQELDEILSKTNDENSLKRQIRRFRCEKMMCIAWNDMLGNFSLDECFAELSYLAEIIIVKVLDHLYKQMCKVNGTPIGEFSGKEQKMLVIGMGKLGGRELNFSSDIDLIFCYPERGETVGGRRSIDNQLFFTRLGQQFIQVLDQKTQDGQVYRVDMRLRPFGDSGPLVSSFAALETYYLQHGRSWERYAMVKGRVLGDESEETKELMSMLRPFVFRRYLDFSAIESLRKMKSLIEAEVRRRQLSDNFKLGKGGIREIEFIAQVFQLMRGGRDKTLQERHLLTVIEKLKNCGCIEEHVADMLVRCYTFLRRTENLLQEINDEQTQTLPSKQIDQERLASLLGFEDYCEFLSNIDSVMKDVNAEFSLLISDPENQVEEENSVFADLWLLPLKNDEISKIIESSFKDNSNKEEFIDSFQFFKKECTNKPISSRGREILNKLVPLILSKISEMPNRVYETFNRISGLFLKIVLRTTYLQLIVENIGVCEHLIKLCSGSKLIAQQLTEHPVLLDELLMPNALYKPTRLDDYPQELREFMLRVDANDLERQMETLRQFKQIQLLRICASDLVGALPLMKVSDNLTFLAQTILESVVNLTWAQLVEKYGEPSNSIKNGDKGLCVIGYGKFGGIELGYNSDLDLVFLCDDDLDGETSGDNSVSDRMFYGRFAQRLMHLFSTRLSSGILYDVDARLRPEGVSGPLICTISAYENYLKTKSWTWEQQALVRARAVLGPERLTSRFNKIRECVLRIQRDDEKLREEVLSMRKKMRVSKGPATAFDIKQGVGGMVDIEFITQYLVLKYSSKFPDFVLWSDNVRILDECARLGILEQGSVDDLKESYIAIRNVGHRMNLQGITRIVFDDELDVYRDKVTRLWKQVFNITEV